MHALALWLPVIALMAAIFLVSSTNPCVPVGGADKLAHVGVYGLLSALTFRALCGGRLFLASWVTAAGAILIASAYGVTDELHQALVPGRSPERLDIVADIIGASLVAGVLWTWSILERSNRPH